MSARPLHPPGVAIDLPGQLGLGPFRPRAPWWGADLQTLRDTLRPDPVPVPDSTPLQISLADGGSLLAWHDLPHGAASSDRSRGLVLVLHGLGGSSQAEGVRRLGWRLNQAGLAVLRLNMRGAGDGRALASGTYAARCSPDLAPAFARARELADGTPLLAVGLSLGGTVLLNAVLDGVAPLDGLALVSSPLDLAHCSATISAPRNRLYERWLLERLRRQTLAEAPHPEAEGADGELHGALRRVRSIRAFDALVTAPRWGYASVDDYYRRASPLPRLLEAAVLPPILVVQALDDPWVPAAGALALAGAGQTQQGWGENLRVVITPQGGHNGFHAPGGCWSDELVLRWLSRRLAAAV